MLKKIFAMLAFASFLAAPLSAAVARTYPDALAKTGKNPIVIFLYGANYDKVSQKTYEIFIKKNKIAPFIRQCTFLEMPLYQMPSDKEKKDMEKRLGNKRLPGGIRNYPCLAIVDAKGNLRGAVQSPEEMKDPETALASLKKKIEAFYAQDKLIEKALKAKGEKRAALLLAASDYDLEMPRGVLDKKDKKAEDGSGLGNRMDFDPLSVVEALQTMEYDEANSYVREMMAQGGYSKLQRQMIMAAYAGHLRRGGEGKTPASKERLRALYTEMRNIDPNSTYGAYAEGAIVIWVEGGKLTEDPIPTEINRVGNTSDDGNSSGSSSGNTAMGSTSIPAADDDEPASADGDVEDDSEGDDF